MLGRLVLTILRAAMATRIEKATTSSSETRRQTDAGVGIIRHPCDRKIPFESGRGDWIRTSDPLRPRQVRYQAALRPDCCLILLRFADGTLIALSLAVAKLSQNPIRPRLRTHLTWSRTLNASHAIRTYGTFARRSVAVLAVQAVLNVT